MVKLMSTSSPPSSTLPDLDQALARLGVGLDSPTLGRKIAKSDVALAGDFDPSQLSPSKTIPGLNGSRRAGLTRVKLALIFLDHPDAHSDETAEDVAAAKAIVAARAQWLPEMLDYSVESLAEKLVEWGLALPGTAAGILAGRLDAGHPDLEAVYDNGGWSAVADRLKVTAPGDGSARRDHVQVSSSR